MYGPYEDIYCNSIKRLSLMDVAILVYETYTIKLQCGSHFSIHELYILCNGFILRMTFCECTLWPFGGEGESRREFPRLLFLSIGYVLGRNSVHNIFLGFRYILEIFTINVLSILMYTVVPLTYKKIIACHCKLSPLSPVRHSALLNSYTLTSLQSTVTGCF